jgi:acetyltransferase-like isoleucine patch superfamily enzyme
MYYSEDELLLLGFQSIGRGVKISNKACIYNHSEISIGDNSRIDDLCVISGKLNIGRNVHITPMCLLAGGQLGIVLEDFTTLAYGVKIFTQTDDYSGKTMTNSTIPKRYKSESINLVTVKKHTIIGASAIIMPGVVLEEGTSVGAMSLVLKSTNPWGIYAGVPAKRIKDRRQDLRVVESLYILNHSI